jgi:hypothetical protein
MSFDTEFDYSPAVRALNDTISKCYSQIESNTATITLLQSSVYTTITSPEIDRLTTYNASHQTEITNCEAILDEITRIRALTAENKALIYYFYTVLGVRKSIFMTKMLFNTVAVTDPRVLEVYSDTTSSSELKLYVARLIYDTFHIDNRYPQTATMRLYL